MPGLPMLRIVILGIDPSGLPFSLCSNVFPKSAPYPKPFKQSRLSGLFGFFAPRLFTKASFRHSLETKKPLICMRGFVATIGASLDEFAGDIRSILELKLN
jgi:hypothetical protein